MIYTERVMHGCSLNVKQATMLLYGIYNEATDALYLLPGITQWGVFQKALYFNTYWLQQMHPNWQTTFAYMCDFVMNLFCLFFMQSTLEFHPLFSLGAGNGLVPPGKTILYNQCLPRSLTSRGVPNYKLEWVNAKRNWNIGHVNFMYSF